MPIVTGCISNMNKQTRWYHHKNKLCYPDKPCYCTGNRPAVCNRRWSTNEHLRCCLCLERGSEFIVAFGSHWKVVLSENTNNGHGLMDDAEWQEPT
jgi:hypothetical protein